jgi:hypothetical protein
MADAAYGRASSAQECLPFWEPRGTKGELCCVSTLPVVAFLRMPRGKDEPKVLGELGAKPFRGGEENRAKDAKDAKVKGKKGNYGQVLCRV